MDPSEAQGQTFMGKIKSYSIGKGYGFIISEKVQGDLFFVHKNLPKDVVHRTQDNRDFKLDEKEVAFTVEISSAGKPTAIDIRLLADSGSSATSKGKGKGKASDKGRSKNSWEDSYDKGSSKGKGHNPYDHYGSVEGKGSKGISGTKGKSTSKAAGKGTKKAKTAEPGEPGIPLLDERAQAKMKSYSNGSKWGFAICDPAVGDFGDIFVHANNLDDELQTKGIQLRDGDVIEMDLEEVNGKPVAKNVTIVPQEPNAFVSQWMKGTIKSFTPSQGYGFINAPRIWGDIWFAKTDLAKSMVSSSCAGTDVMFRLNVGVDGKGKAKFVNALRGLDEWEGSERAQQVIQSLQDDGFVDETAVKALNDTDAGELLRVLPELAFYKADNPSSFILGALSRSRKGGKGKGKGGYRASPY